jgi:hypothetical protein
MNLPINFGDFLRRRAFITPHIEATVEPALDASSTRAATASRRP